MSGSNPFAVESLMGHVKDAEEFHFPRFFSPATDGIVHVPQFRESSEPVVSLTTGTPKIDELIDPLNLRITKFMIIEVIVAVIMVIVFVWIARKIATGQPPKGKVWNLIEAMLLFIRDQVARPAIGKKDADKFVPFLWTLFFFILGCNLLGLVPWLGSPTGAMAVTGALALLTFGVVVLSGSLSLGVIGFWKAQVPHMEMHWTLSPLKIGIFLIEVLGLCIKHFVLAIRLLANMMAGHLVVAVIIGFVAAASAGVMMWGVVPTTGIGWLVTTVSIFGAVAITMLELFVAFLQAYIFAFLAALFIGMAVHPH